MGSASRRTPGQFLVARLGHRLGRGLASERPGTPGARIWGRFDVGPALLSGIPMPGGLSDGTGISPEMVVVAGAEAATVPVGSGGVRPSIRSPRKARRVVQVVAAREFRAPVASLVAQHVVGGSVAPVVPGTSGPRRPVVSEAARSRQNAIAPAAPGTRPGPGLRARDVVEGRQVLAVPGIPSAGTLQPALPPGRRAPPTSTGAREEPASSATRGVPRLRVPGSVSALSESPDVSEPGVPSAANPAAPGPWPAGQSAMQAAANIVALRGEPPPGDGVPGGGKPPLVGAASEEPDARPATTPALPGSLVGALARARSPEEVIETVLAGTGRVPASGSLPPAVFQLVDLIRREAAEVEGAAEVPRKRAPSRLPREKREQGSGERRPRAMPLTRLLVVPSTGDKERVTRLVRKLQQLIHLAEAERRAVEARSQVRLAEDSNQARTEASAPIEPASERYETKVDVEALGREVLEAVIHELEMRQARRVEDADVRRISWW